MTEEPTHIYDWLDQPADDDAERDAKEWLNQFCKPAYDKYKQGTDKWLSRYRLTVEWRGQRYICTGASRMGDVWLKNEGSSNFYDHRVNVDNLSNWKRIVLPVS
jgi:hypothetical protein